MLWTFNNWNIIQLTNKTTLSEDFYEIHKVDRDGISEYVESFVQSVKYGDINKAYSTKMGYYAIKYMSDAIKFQEYITSDGQVR